MTLPTTDGERELRTSETEQEMWALADERDISQARHAYPSGWLWLTAEPSVRSLLDALTEASDGHRYGTDNLASMAELTEAEVEDAIDGLISLGVLVADEGAYRVNEHAIVYHAVTKLSNAVEGTGAPGDESGFAYLSRHESVRLMIDALLETEPDQPLTQEAVHRLTGVSRKRVWLHVEKLVDLSVLEETGDEYELDPTSPVLRWVQSLDAAVVGASLASSHP